MRVSYRISPSHLFRRCDASATVPRGCELVCVLEVYVLALHVVVVALVVLVINQQHRYLRGALLEHLRSHQRQTLYHHPDTAGATQEETEGRTEEGTQSGTDKKEHMKEHRKKRRKERRGR